jgi:aspartyl protease family protein
MQRRRVLGALGAFGAFGAQVLAAAALPRPAFAAPGVALAGRMGDRALLVIEGQPRAVAVGQTVAGIKLLRWTGDEAEVETPGGHLFLRVGATPVQVGANASRKLAREVVMTAGPGGHFTSAGAINGKAVHFMVDTGATLVSLGRDDATRLGIDLKDARSAMTQTANGPVPVQLVVLSSVRVGEVELNNVGAAVVPQPMPIVLLGNSFLARMQMRRDNDVMRLELK